MDIAPFILTVFGNSTIFSKKKREVSKHNNTLVLYRSWRNINPYRVQFDAFLVS